MNRNAPFCTLPSLRRALKQVSDPARAVFVARFFKTKKGEYGYGDVFRGADVPNCRKIAKQFADLPRKDVSTLLHSRIHEERLVALLILTHQFEAGDAGERGGVYRFYMAHTQRINNWDLVDVSAHKIVGAYLVDRSRGVLDRLARSPHLWTRRIAIVATFAFIRRGETADTFRIARLLRDDPHELIHKATGWMLREAGKKDLAALRRFLAIHAPHMPRTMLRYAIERMEPYERRRIQATTHAPRVRGSSE